MTRPERIYPEAQWTAQVLECFRQDEPVALPTETVYGLAAPADQIRAVARIFEIKQRPTFNPLILHVREDWDISEWAETNDLERKLIKLFWPGPLSLLLKKKNVSDLVTAGSDYVVVRAPKHPIFREVLAAYGKPLVAPSANSSTKLSPTSADAVSDDLGTKLRALVDGGICEYGIESTILEIRDGKIIMLREGAVSREDLAEFAFIKAQASAITPGTKLKHYSPQTPLRFLENKEEWQKGEPGKTCWIKVLHSDGPDLVQSTQVHCLAPDNDYKTAAHALFEYLRHAQTLFQELRVLKTQDKFLGRAINDRLLRASEG